VKPHIVYIAKTWYCYKDGVIGQGMSPHTAYIRWRWDKHRNDVLESQMRIATALVESLRKDK